VGDTTLSSLRSAFRSLFAPLRNQPSEIPRLRISDQFPNVLVTDQFGVETGFRDRYLVGGKSLIFSPMYTTCRGACPGTAATLKRLRRELAPVFGRQLVIVSFTVDPVADRPPQLLQYATGYDAEQRSPDLPDWDFLTGTAESMERIRRALGFYDLNPRLDSDPTRHDATLLFGNPQADRWATLPAQLRVSLLLETIRRVAGSSFEQRYGISG
jgi:protein SCO1/2